MTWWMVLALLAIPPFYLLALSWASRTLPYPWPPLRAQEKPPQTRFRVVIPAHNEALHITAAVEAARALDYPQERFQVVVVANACSDETAALAETAGATVYTFDPPGKGGALDYLFRTLAADPEWDAVVVVDADSTLDPQALRVLDALFAAGADAVQLRYAVKNATAHPRTEIAAVQLASLNGIRPLGRDRLGWSAGIYGNGFALARATIEAVPYRAYGVVEDLEYHQHLFLAGKRVRFADAAAVWAEMPVARHQLATQRVRWERGKLWTIRHYFGPVVRHFPRRPWATQGQLFDLMVPPIAWVALGHAVLLLFAPLPVRLGAAAAFAAILLHYLHAAHRYQLLPLFGRALAHAPGYIAEKLWAVLRSLLTERELGWRRTERK
ncbi:glycosyltransferase family 2 protein [Hydrogenophilus islandicus]